MATQQLLKQDIESDAGKRGIIRCPRCSSDVYYKYGRIKDGRKRYLCLNCNRQFISGAKWQEMFGRPRCPDCNKAMHVYMKNKEYIRFRCSNYPDCRTYLKLKKGELENYGAIRAQRTGEVKS